MSGRVAMAMNVSQPRFPRRSRRSRPGLGVALFERHAAWTRSDRPRRAPRQVRAQRVRRHRPLGNELANVDQQTSAFVVAVGAMPRAGTQPRPGGDREEPGTAAGVRGVAERGADVRPASPVAGAQARPGSSARPRPGCRPISLSGRSTPTRSSLCAPCRTHWRQPSVRRGPLCSSIRGSCRRDRRALRKGDRGVAAPHKRRRRRPCSPKRSRPT
jgi:hypothetical protein